MKSGLIHMIRRPPWLVILAMFVANGISAAIAQPEPQGRRADVIYMDQPTGIDYGAYQNAWPSLASYIEGLKRGEKDAVRSQLKQRSLSADASDGELNLLAQLDWQSGDLDSADREIGKALQIHADQSLNWFQRAMTAFAHLQQVAETANSYEKGLGTPFKGLETWKWQRRTRAAYQRTLDLDRSNQFARYYVAYSYINTPSILGGDTAKAIKLSDEGIALGQVGFYAVRADAHRERGELDAANADYDTAISLKVMKLGGFLDAAKEELERKHLERAKRYYDWAIYCRPDSSKAYEGLGDYFVAAGDLRQAAVSYQTAVDRNPRNDSATKKLKVLPGSP